MFIGVLNSYATEKPAVTEKRDVMTVCIKMWAYIFSLFYQVCALVTSLFLLSRTQSCSFDFYSEYQKTDLQSFFDGSGSREAFKKVA